ncbi:BrnT family toxin [Aerophototrophica crusticola]|uniref:BrnT family toxin n=1 Tax=Aerophototrophica crusticola TaxID=1709002 RepID=A0A858R9E1_9PROT|nr:BrnT family toxin [Rhodospirillaceae bacterium B3]
MAYEWDEAKRQANLAKHGVDFALAADLEWNTALTVPDTRFGYGEERNTTFGFIRDRLYALVWTPRADGVVRIISLRKANRREVRIYGWANEQGRLAGTDPAGPGSHH